MRRNILRLNELQFFGWNVLTVLSYVEIDPARKNLGFLRWVSPGFLLTTDN